MKTRKIWEVAYDIRAAWPNVYFGAKPYLDAMDQLDDSASRYGAEYGRDIVIYFLANASTFRGEKARALKAELKHICGVN